MGPDKAVLAGVRCGGIMEDSPEALDPREDKKIKRRNTAWEARNKWRWYRGSVGLAPGAH